MPEFRMTLIVLQQQTGMFADARDAVEVVVAAFDLTWVRFDLDPVLWSQRRDG